MNQVQQPASLPMASGEPAASSRAVGDAKPRIRGGISSEAIRAYTMVIALILIWLYFHYATGAVFLTPRNLSNLMLQTSVTGVLSVGMLLVIVAGHIDLSVGSLIGLAGGIAAVAMTWHGWGPWAAIIAALAVGTGIGALQGSLAAYANIPSFIVTLGGLLAWRGALKGISAGNTIPVSPQSFKTLGQGYIAPNVGLGLAGIAIAAMIWVFLRRNRARRLHGLASYGTIGTVSRIAVPSILILAFVLVMNSYHGIPIPAILLVAVALAGAFLARNTTFGRYLYAIGGNPDAARLSGINLRGHVMAVFAVMGSLAGVAAIINTARIGSASPEAGVLKELDAIAACVIGGASLMGGRGTVFGACLGALIMASLDNGMSLLNVRDYMQDIIKGSILVAAVGLDMVGRRRG
ncbi:MAG: sugar ABC transporter permease [Blastocatellia bacterium]